VLLGRLSDIVDDAAQVMRQAIVVPCLDAKENGLGVARDRAKGVIDVVPRTSDPHIANRDRQPS
jgi:hypothetical protein